jgi:hypothetical protein
MNKMELPINLQIKICKEEMKTLRKRLKDRKIYLKELESKE